MYKVSEIISKPVFTIYEGVKIGTIVNFLYDNCQKKIKGFFIFDDDSDVQEQFIKTKNVFAMGEDYVLMKNKNKAQISSYENKDFINLKAVSINGENAGEVIDLFFDEKFKVEGIETNRGVVLPANSIINVGKDIVVFDNNDKKVRVSKMKPVNKIIIPDLASIKVNILEEKVISTIPIISNNFNENSFVMDKKIVSEIEKEIQIPRKISLPSKVLSNPKSIIGKSAKVLVCGMNGEVIIKKGQMITDKIYEKAQKHSKLFELTNSI